MSKSTLKCKSATLMPDGGISTTWEDSRDTTAKYEIIIDPEIAKCYIDYYNWEKEQRLDKSKDV